MVPLICGEAVFQWFQVGTRPCRIEETPMPAPNLPQGFDPTDPDVTVKRLPVDELAELRKTQPIWWCEQTPGHAGGFNDGGYWVVTKHKDVKEVSLRSDVFSSYENGVIPRFNDDIAREDVEV